MPDVKRNAPAPVDLGIASAGKLSLNRSALEKGGSVRGDQFDGAKQFLSGLDAKATVRIINGRQSNKTLLLGTKTTRDFFSRKPLTREFFKQACIAKFGGRDGDVAKAFDTEYARLDRKTAHTAPSLLGMLGRLEQRFAPSVAPQAAEKAPEHVLLRAADVASAGADKVIANPRIADPVIADPVVAAPVNADPIVDASMIDDAVVEDAVVEEDVPDLLVEPSAAPLASKATEALTKAHGFSVQTEAPPFRPKVFNMLDSGDHAPVGKAIDARLEELGLQAKRGISKIEVNGEKVYCYFDAAGKARAVLPKGSVPKLQEATVRTVDLNIPKDDYYNGHILYWNKFEGRNTDFQKVDMDRKVLSAIVGTIDKKIRGTARAEAMRDLFKPLEEEGRMVLQFSVGDDPWIVDLVLLPGKRLKDLNGNNTQNCVSAVVSPLDEPLPDGVTSLADLAAKAGKNVFAKNSRIKVSPDYRGVTTDADGNYVKKFYQVRPEAKSAFFEHLLANEQLAPGITNRMLGGVPTADEKKTIGPSGPSSMLRWSTLPEDRLPEFEAAVMTAVDDLFILTKAGFQPPERKPEHYLCDMTAEKIEIKMIDFGSSHSADVQMKRDSFQKGFDALLSFTKNCFENGKAAKNEMTSGATADAFLERVRAHAARRASEIA